MSNSNESIHCCSKFINNLRVLRWFDAPVALPGKKYNRKMTTCLIIVDPFLPLRAIFQTFALVVFIQDDR
jgi:hypothetical protein